MLSDSRRQSLASHLLLPYYIYCIYTNLWQTYKIFNNLSKNKALCLLNLHGKISANPPKAKSAPNTCRAPCLPLPLPRPLPLSPLPHSSALCHTYLPASLTVRVTPKILLNEFAAKPELPTFSLSTLRSLNALFCLTALSISLSGARLRSTSASAA